MAMSASPSSFRFEPRLLRIFRQKDEALTSCTLPLRGVGFRFDNTQT
jgi:hypothetical protein